MATEADNMKAPESIDELDFECDNLDDGGLGEDFGAIDADDDDDEESDLMSDKLENPIKKSDDGDDDEDGGEDDDDDDDDDNDDDAKKSDCGDDDDDDLKKQAKKGGWVEKDLEKSCQKLLNHVKARDPSARRAALLSKASAGHNLTKSEQAQLYRLLGGMAAKGEAKEGRLSKSLSENKAVQRTIEASEFLSNLCNSLTHAMGGMEKSFNQMSNRDAQFNLLLARTVAEVGQSVARQNQEIARLSKAMARQGSAPVAAPKSLGAAKGRARPLAKSSMGEGRSQTLSHDQIERGFDGMMMKSLNGRPGKTAKGTDIVKAHAHFASCGQVRPEIQDELTAFIRENR